MGFAHDARYALILWHSHLEAPAPVNAYGYLGFSTPEQAQGDSDRRQVEAV
jgi:hypothetical protein